MTGKNTFDVELRRIKYIRDFLTESNIQLLHLQTSSFVDHRHHGVSVPEGQYVQATVTVLIPIPAKQPETSSDDSSENTTS